LLFSGALQDDPRNHTKEHEQETGDDMSFEKVSQLPAQIRRQSRIVNGQPRGKARES
jgi:hypothetical protein